MKNSLFFFLTVSLVSAAASLAPAATISNVAVRQRWPWSQKVDIDYTLATDNPVRVNLAVYSGNTQLAIPEGAISGEQLVASTGAHTLVFDPAKTMYTNCVMANLRFVLTAGEPPLYMIVDLTKSPSDTNQITYLTAYDLTNSASAYGSWAWGNTAHTGPYVETNWQNTVIWTGVTNDTRWATSNLVMRYIPAGTYLWGSPTNELGRNNSPGCEGTTGLTEVVFSKAFFAGVFPVTQTQYAMLMSTNPSTRTKTPNRPVDSVSFDTLRGCWTNEAGLFTGYNWPSNGHAVASDSAIGAFRSRTGIEFDLPTIAQWEVACRAGTTGAWNNGTTITNLVYDDNLSLLGWIGNTNRVYDSQPVGGKPSNGWGLYDMHGNVLEWCLDWAGNISRGRVTDPVGPMSSNNKARYLKGGSWNVWATTDYFHAIYWARSAALDSFNGDPHGVGVGQIGFRLFAPAE